MTNSNHLADLPALRAVSAPDALCIDDDRVELDNAEFERRVAATASLLSEHGVGSGDVVATLLANRVELVVAMFAAWGLGAALNPVNPTLTPAEAEYQIRDSNAKVIIHADDAPAIDGVVTVAVEDLPVAPPAGFSLVADRSDDALALLIYTSGTTGKPKGVQLDHANLNAMVTMIGGALQVTENDHSLLILPLFHVNGIVVSVLTPLAANGRTSITARFSPSTFFETIEATRPTYFSAVPAIYAMLSNLPAEVQPDTSSVRVAVCGAAPMPAELIERFESRYGIPLTEGYGLSEGTCASTTNPIDGVRKPGTVGLPLPGQEVKLLGEDGVPTTEGRGEVIVRGPNVMRGYLNKPEATAETVVDGWLRTGDVGIFDEDGYLKIVDRVKDMIIRGGENIYPKEIENVLYTHPEVLEAAVVGRPHDVLGEEPVAFVSLRTVGAVEADELRQLCTDQLARHKVPVDVILAESLPKNPVGKIAKPTLRESFTSLAEIS